MGRGKSFNHKKKGHDHKISKLGQHVPTKNTDDVEYAIETVATVDRRPVSIVEKD